MTSASRSHLERMFSDGFPCPLKPTAWRREHMSEQKSDPLTNRFETTTSYLEILFTRLNAVDPELARELRAKIKKVIDSRELGPGCRSTARHGKGKA